MTVEERIALYKAIEAKAFEKTHCEAAQGDPWGYNPGDSGNFGDAHSEGVDDGEIYMARKVLPLLKELMPETQEKS